MLKVGIIGERTTIFPFTATGVEVYPVEGNKEAKAILKSLKLEEYGLLILTEEVRRAGEEFLKKKDKELPLLLFIPGLKEKRSRERERIERSIRRATGRLE